MNVKWRIYVFLLFFEDDCWEVGYGYKVVYYLFSEYWVSMNFFYDFWWIMWKLFMVEEGKIIWYIICWVYFV